MNIGSQWNDRLRIWAEQFPKYYYRKAAALSVSYFTTMEHEMTAGAADPQGRQVAYNCLSWPRRIQGVTVPAQSSAVLEPSAVPEHPVRLRYLEQEKGYELSNAYLTCRVNDRGELVSVKKWRADTEYLAGVGNRLLMFKDVNTYYDAWELGSMYENLPVPLEERTTVTMQPGTYRAALGIHRKIGASAMMPDQNADRGMQQFTYAFYPFDGAFADSDVPQRAAEQNEPVVFSGITDGLGPIFLADAQNILVETIKPADTADNALLVRAYEAMGKQTDCAFAANPRIAKVVETDMLEEDLQAVDPPPCPFRPL